MIIKRLLFLALGLLGFCIAFYFLREFVYQIIVVFNIITQKIAVDRAFWVRLFGKMILQAFFLFVIGEYIVPFSYQAIKDALSKNFR